MTVGITDPAFRARTAAIDDRHMVRADIGLAGIEGLA